MYSIACWCLGVLFIYAGTLKLMAPQAFATLIDAYGILPEPMLLPVAVILPALEVLVGVGLFLNIRGSLTAITLLLLMFVAILVYGIWMGLDVDCGCFGPQDPESEAFHGLWRTLFRDLFMLSGIAFLFWLRRHLAIEPVSLGTLGLLSKRRKSSC